LSRGKIPFSVFALGIIIGYEYCLHHLDIRGYDNLTEFIVSAPRTDWFSQNREGVFSFLGIVPDIVSKVGYLAIFLVGVDIGGVILAPEPPKFSFIDSPSKALAFSLGVFSAISTVGFYLSVYFDFQVSRRFVCPLSI